MYPFVRRKPNFETVQTMSPAYWMSRPGGRRDVAWMTKRNRRAGYCVRRSGRKVSVTAKGEEPRQGAEGEAYASERKGWRRVMDDYRDVRCLFCTTGKEESAVRLIHAKEWGRAIFPKRVKRVLKGHEWVDVSTPLLPGYVFVYSGGKEKTWNSEGYELNRLFRVLTYCEGMDTLTGRDREFADWLWQLDGQVGSMKAVQVGDRIEVVDGLFKQLHGTITRMDRRRKTMRVELDTKGPIRQIWLSYEIIRELEDNSTALHWEHGKWECEQEKEKAATGALANGGDSAAGCRAADADVPRRNLAGKPE